MMNTLVCDTPGKFRFEERAIPVPKNGQIVIRVKRIGVCGTDLHAFEGTQPFFSYPRVLGHEISGTVHSVGNGVTEFEIGDAVTLLPYYSCGKCIACRNNRPNCCTSIQVAGVHVDGAMSDFYIADSQYFVKSTILSLDHLALVEPLSVSHHGLSRAEIKTGQPILIIGAGPIGLGLVAIANSLGAEVSVIDINPDRLAFCERNLQPAHLIDGRDNPIEQVREITHNQMMEVVIDATGNLRALESGLSYLAHSGRFVLVGLQKESFSFSHPEFHKRETTLMSSRNATRWDFEQVIRILEQGLVDIKPFITHRFSLDDTPQRLPELISPESGAIKAMIDLD